MSLAQELALYLPLPENELVKLSHLSSIIIPVLMLIVITIPDINIRNGLSLLDAGAWIYHWAQNLLSFFGLRKRRRHWGTIYDSVTKQPLDPVRVKLVDVNTNRTVETTITDINGHYGFLVHPGRFFIYPQKTNYQFPSRKQTGQNDLEFDNLYHGEFIDIVGDSDVLMPNIPMDPTGFDWNQQDKQHIVKFHVRREYTITILAVILFVIGSIYSLFILFLQPSVLNIILFWFYAIIALAWVLTRSRRLWGQISASEPVQGLYLELHRYGQMDIVMAHSAAGQDGKFFLHASEPGEYKLVVKRGRNGPVIHERKVRTDKDGIVINKIRI